jgi:hypothetical protein
MAASLSPFEIHPPTRQRLITSILAAIAGAALVLVTIVLPAEYGIDPTGAGRLLGLTSLHQPSRTLVIEDVIGGNENYRQTAVPSFRDPVPLPNPAVAQIKPAAARTETFTVHLEPGQQTEIKAVLDSAQVILYSWKAEGGNVYTDFHGHEPDTGDDAFVRYEEQKSGTEGHGSLVAPFSGEHGWYWLNISEQPVTVTLTFTGYHRDSKNYGLF